MTWYYVANILLKCILLLFVISSNCLHAIKQFWLCQTQLAIYTESKYCFWLSLLVYNVHNLVFIFASKIFLGVKNSKSWFSCWHFYHHLSCHFPLPFKISFRFLLYSLFMFLSISVTENLFLLCAFRMLSDLFSWRTMSKCDEFARLLFCAVFPPVFLCLRCSAFCANVNHNEWELSASGVLYGCYQS